MADNESLLKAKQEKLADLRAQHERVPSSFTTLLGGMNTLVGDTRSQTKGVHSFNPASTPKYRTSIDGATETMGRMLIPFSDPEIRKRFVASLPAGSARTLGDALAVTESSSQCDTAASTGLGYIDFLLQSAQESYAEKVQVVDVLSDNYVAYFFGQEPPVFSYQGTLLNTYQDDWRSAFSIIYNEIIRGTKLARRRRLMTLTYDNVAVTGTAVRMSQTLTADMEMASSFTLDILVKRYDIYRLPGTTFNSPSEFTDLLGKVVDPNTFTGLKLGRVRRTYRTVRPPQVATSVPKKDKGKTERTENVIPEPDLGPGGPNDIRNYVPPEDTDDFGNDCDASSGDACFINE